MIKKLIKAIPNYLILRLGKMCQVSGVKKPPGKELYLWSLKSKTFLYWLKQRLTEGALILQIGEQIQNRTNF